MDGRGDAVPSRTTALRLPPLVRASPRSLWLPVRRGGPLGPSSQAPSARRLPRCNVTAMPEPCARRPPLPRSRSPVWLAPYASSRNKPVVSRSRAVAIPAASRNSRAAACCCWPSPRSTTGTNQRRVLAYAPAHQPGQDDSAGQPQQQREPVPQPNCAAEHWRRYGTEHRRAREDDQRRTSMLHPPACEIAERGQRETERRGEEVRRDRQAEHEHAAREKNGRRRATIVHTASAAPPTATTHQPPAQASQP